MAEQLLFADRQAFRQWLSKNYATSDGTWLIFSKNDKIKTIKSDEALEEALCFGWIDTLVKRLDGDRYIKKFTPRRKDSKWSETNKETVKELIKEGRMAKPGMKAVEEAKRNGRWDAPKRQPITESQIEILAKALSGAEPASANFLKSPPSQKRSYTGYYLDAKQEAARHNRLKKIIKNLNENKKPMF